MRFFEHVRSNAVSGGYAPVPPPPSPASGPLFRPEALAAQHELRWGRPIGLMPLPWRAITLFLAVLVTAIAVFLVSAQYSRKESARGVLRPVGGEARVIASQGGVVRELYVAEGARVERGTPLARISRETALADGAIADEDVLDAMRAEERMLRSQLETLGNAAPLDARALESNLAALQAERAAALAAKDLGGQRLRIAAARVVAARPLVPGGLLAAEELRRREEAELSLREEVSNADARARSLAAQIAETQARRAKLPLDLTRTQAQLEAQLAALRQRRAQAEAARGYELRAPVSGRVSALQAAVGQPVDASRVLMTLVPPDARLVAEVYVPSRAIGFIEPGQSVRLLYDAYPYQRFGAARGEVEAVSATVLQPQEVQAALKIEEPVYRVVVSIARQDMPAFGRRSPLSAGMALTADIVLEQRSFAAWLFEPVLAMRGRL